MPLPAALEEDDRSAADDEGVLESSSNGDQGHDQADVGPPGPVDVHPGRSGDSSPWFDEEGNDREQSIEDGRRRQDLPVRDGKAG